MNTAVVSAVFVNCLLTCLFVCLIDNNNNEEVRRGETTLTKDAVVLRP